MSGLLSTLVVLNVFAQGAVDYSKTEKVGKPSWKYKDWRVSTLSEAVMYVTDGNDTPGHDFGFIKSPGSCSKDTIWLSWSTTGKKGIELFEGELVLIRFTIDDIEFQYKVPLSYSQYISEFLTIITFTDVEVSDRMISLLKRGTKVNITIVPPEKMVSKFDIFSDSFSLKGFTASMLKASEFCEKESVAADMDTYGCIGAIDEDLLLDVISGNAETRSKSLSFIETCLPLSKTMQTDMNSFTEKFIIDIEKGVSLPFQLQSSSIRHLYELTHLNAQVGNGPSQHNFAVIHNAPPAGMLFACIPQDINVFRYWTLKAASQGISGSMFNLAVRLANDDPTDGFLQDNVMAYNLFLILKKMGHSPQTCSEVRSKIEQELGHEQIEIIKDQFNNFELSSLIPEYEEPIADFVDLATTNVAVASSLYKVNTHGCEGFNDCEKKLNLEDAYLITPANDGSSVFNKSHVDGWDRILKYEGRSILSKRILNLKTAIKCVENGYLPKDKKYDLEYEKYKKKYGSLYRGAPASEYGDQLYNKSDIETVKLCELLVNKINQPLPTVVIKKKPIVASFVTEKGKQLLNEIYLLLGKICRHGSNYHFLVYKLLKSDLLAISSMYNYSQFNIEIKNDPLFGDDRISALIFNAGIRYGKNSFLAKATKEDYELLTVKWKRFKNIGYKVGLKWVPVETVEVPNDYFFTENNRSRWLKDVDY